MFRKDVFHKPNWSGKYRARCTIETFSRGLGSLQTLSMALPQASSKSVVSRTVAVLLLLGSMVPAVNARQQQVTCNPANLRFGKVVAGQMATLPVTMTNNGPSSVTVSDMTVSAPVFRVDNLILPVTLTAGQKINFSVTFSPTMVGSADGVVVFTGTMPGGTLSLPVSGKGVNNWSLSANPSSLSFGNVQVGNQVTLPLSVVNSGTSSATVSSGRLSGTGFSVSGVTLPLTLDAGQSYTFRVTFAPQTGGPASGSILATSPLSPVLTVPLTGNGTDAGQLTAFPATLPFGNVTVGDSAIQTGTLSASGASVTVSSATSSSPEFALSGISLPLNLMAGQSTSYTVTFSPQNSGTASATVSFVSNAANSPTIESLTGNGTPPTQHTVSLSWDASVSEVVGYNVYRSPTSRGPYARINAILDPSTTYVDSAIASGQTYYYVTTALNSAGDESGFSNEVQVTIP